MNVVRGIAALWLFGWSAALCHGQQPIPVEQAKEVLRTWERISTPAPLVRVRLTTIYENWKDGQFVPKRKAVNTYRRSSSGFALITQTDTIDEQGVGKMVGATSYLCNTHYESRLSSAKSNEWRIEEMGGSSLTDPSARSVANSDFVYATDVIVPWLRVDGYLSFFHLLHDPRCIITRVDPATGGSRRFHFVISPDVPSPAESKILTKSILFFHGNIKGGWFEVSGDYHRIDRYDVESVVLPKKVDTYRQIGEIEYISNSRLPFPFPRSHVTEVPVLKMPDGSSLRTRTVHNYELEYSPGSDESEYYLSHYGLPEPEGVTPPKKPIPLYVWLLAGAGGFALIALVCRWLLRRRRTAGVSRPVVPDTQQPPAG